MRQLLSYSFAGVLLASQVNAQSVDDFDAVSAQMDAEFNKQTQRIDDIYQAVDKAIDRAFSGLTRKIEVKWPDGALPDRHRWVTYNKSMTSRAIADYEKGELVVETLLEPNTDVNEQVAELVAMTESLSSADSASLDEQDMLLQTINEEVQKAAPNTALPTKPATSTFKDILPTGISKQLKVLENLNREQGVGITPKASTVDQVAKLNVASKALDTKTLPVAEAEPKPATPPSQPKEIAVVAPQKGNDAPLIEKAPITEPVPDKPQSKPVDNAQSEAAMVAAKAPAKTRIPVVEVVEENGQTKLQLRIAFVNDYQEKLFEEYFDEIKQYAAKYDVPVSVIMAIIETESSFNPRAVSPIPAFGLMQLVPKTAGVDAHLFLTGEKKVVSADYLFNEQNNLKLGSAYFHLLTHRYLRKITDSEARFFCAVASYNTGVGNLARTFTGKKSINSAVKKINELESQAVYDFLMENLPAEETRNYLRKVVTRMEKYKQFDA